MFSLHVWLPGALLQLQAELTDELRDEHIVEDLSVAVMSVLKHSSMDITEVSRIVQQLREWVLAGTSPPGSTAYPYDEL